MNFIIEGVTLEFVSPNMFEKGIEYFRKYQLSFTDYVQDALLMGRSKDRYIASFDRGFDQVKGIVRIS
ncbi:MULTISPECIES: hypothetical protein [Metallosphaera]|uniref:hypothetical protein n=1 Tax=Metallosphaera TaxID=41980 RepID=UPI001F064911|nr:hypothetical protein [Metallosphaera sedula]MCH1771078.1 hypothetical protein [Metallosphaera sedula]MCP6729448.1 hypothetical protein [Metallosphaera sedula]